MRYESFASAINIAQIAIPSCPFISLPYWSHHLELNESKLSPKETTFTTRTLCCNGTNLKFTACTAGHNIQFLVKAVL